MPKLRPPYPPAFRRQMVELARTGRTPEGLTRERVVRMTQNESHFISVSNNTNQISLGLGLVPTRKPHRQHFSYASRASAPNIVQAR